MPSRGPTWVEKGGPQKGGNQQYRQKPGNQTRPGTGIPEVSTPHRQETGPHSRRQLGHMISSAYPQDSNVRRGNQAYTRLRPSRGNEAEVRTGRDQLPQGPARESKLSRRQTKQEQRRPEVQAPRQPNHQPRWREATSAVILAGQEEEKAQVPWLMGNLEQMSVPAFSSE